MSETHEFPDLVTASDDYQSRFDGAVGKWLLQCQDRCTRELLRGRSLNILEVGGGHGQNVEVITAAGHQLTVLGSDQRTEKRIADAVASRRVAFTTGNFLSLPFENRSFDAVISYRTLCHMHSLDRFMDELARVADRYIIVDFPVRLSCNALYGLTFWAKRRVERNTREFRIFSEQALCGEFRERGFAVDRTCKQFFLPMVVHRMLGRRGLSETVERIARGCALTRIFGSPVVACFERASQSKRGR